MNSLLERAILLAVQNHAGQVDRAGVPYILHPIRVMLAGNTPETQIIGALHDLLEDTALTSEMLTEAGFPLDIVDAVIALTKREQESYEDFIERTIQNPLARKVKLNDLRDNLNLLRLNEVTEADIPRLNRYLRAIQRIKEAENHDAGLLGNRK